MQENILNALITTIFIFIAVYPIKKFLLKIKIKKNNQKALKKLKIEKDKENIKNLMKNFKEKQTQAKRKIERQKYPTCLEHLK